VETVTADTVNTERAVRLGNVSKTFPGQRALTDVSIELRGGEVCALIGQNGSGKSTLIKILAGYHLADPGGTVEIDGDVHELDHAGGAWRRAFRFVHQDLGLVDALGALDNLALGVGFAGGGPLSRISWRRQAREARALFAELGIRVDVHTPVAKLSAVQRTMIALARAMRGLGGRAGGVLVLDEPTAALSRPEAEVLFDVVRKVRAQGVAVLFVSHRLDEVLEIADSVAVLRDGRLVAAPRASEVDHDGLVELMIGTSVTPPSPPQSRPQRSVVLSVEGLAGDRLRDFSFELHRGEILGVTGLDGSGRDELALLLFGARARRAGEITLDGKRLSPGVTNAVSGGMALVPAHRASQGLIPTFTVRENMTLARLKPLWKRGLLRRGPERAEARAWGRRVDLRPPDVERPIAELSGGNQQKAILARWLRTEPSVLCLDEPTHGIDIGAKTAVLDLIGSSVGDGMAVVLITSEAEDLARMCDRVLVLSDGEQTAELWGTQLQTETIVTHVLQKRRPEGGSPADGRPDPEAS
jgi:ribose transport system ATP-binding protein